MALQLKGDYARSLAKKYKLVPHLNRVIGQGDFDWEFKYSPKEKDDAWHPSTDCTPNLQALYLKAKGELEERPITVALYKTFMVGHFWHQYLQNIVLEKLQFCELVAIERKGQVAWTGASYGWCSGSADIAPASIPKHGDYLIDIKTMNAHDFRTPHLPKWCADKWECQVNVYMDMFDLDKAIILGVCKDSPHDFKEFEFHKNPTLIDAIYLKWKLVSQCLKNGIEPPPDEDVELYLKGCSV
jgi:hypothetical protein